MRRFTFTEGSSSKFWEIDLDGKTVRTRWGRIGTEGQSQEKNLSSATAAQGEHDKLVREKLKKGYSESREAQPRVAGAKPKAAANPSVWRARVEEMVAALRKLKAVKVTKATLAPPATDAELAAASAGLGRPIPDELAGFYRELNGFELEWESGRSDDEKGRVRLLPIQEVFGNWKGNIWFREGDRFRDVLPFDFFVPEACAAFVRTDDSLRVHYHYCGEELEPTGYGFSAYLERVLESRGYWYFIKALTEATEESTEATTFREEAPGLFKDLDPERFVPATSVPASGGIADLVAQLALPKEVSPATMKALLKAGDEAIVAVGALLGHRAASARLNALVVIKKMGKKAASLLPLVLRAPVRIEVQDVPTDEDSYSPVLMAAISALEHMFSSKDHKRIAKLADEVLSDETAIEPFYLMTQVVGTLLQDSKGRAYAVALAGMQGEDGEDLNAGYAIVRALGRLDDAAAAMKATLKQTKRAGTRRALKFIAGMA